MPNTMDGDELKLYYTGIKQSFTDIVKKLPENFWEISSNQKKLDTFKDVVLKILSYKCQGNSDNLSEEYLKEKIFPELAELTSRKSNEITADFNTLEHAVVKAMENLKNRFRKDIANNFEVDSPLYKIKGIYCNTNGDLFQKDNRGVFHYIGKMEPSDLENFKNILSIDPNVFSIEHPKSL